MTTRPTLASVVIPNQHQQVTTQQEQTQTHSSQPPIFSKPPFTTIAPPSTSSQYDPQNNWIVNRKRPAPGNHQTNHAEKIKKLSNINDLLTEGDRKNIPHCLDIQKTREAKINTENPRFVTNLKYALKTEYNKFAVSERVKVSNITTGEDLFMKASELPILKDFSLNDNQNIWRIKNRNPTTKTYNIRNNQLDIYANVPYAAITAFPSTNEQNEITRESLISENTRFRQELFIKETELQELQMKFESLQMNNTEKGRTTSDDYWRRQYVLTKQLQKTEESNLKQINKAFAQKHLEITSANKKLGMANKELVEQVKQLNCKLEKEKRKRQKQKKLIKSLIPKHEKTPEPCDDSQDIQEVLLIEDDGKSPVPSPVILPPEFFE